MLPNSQENTCARVFLNKVQLFSANPIKSPNVYADRLGYECQKNCFDFGLLVYSISVTIAEKSLKICLFGRNFQATVN